MLRRPRGMAPRIRLAARARRRLAFGKMRSPMPAGTETGHDE